VFAGVRSRQKDVPEPKHNRSREKGNLPRLYRARAHQGIEDELKPLVLIAETTGTYYVDRIKELGWGRMFCFRNMTPFEGEPWGLDNGAFDAWQHDQPFDGISFQSRVRGLMDRGLTPHLAVAPDIVAAGCQSLEFSLDWLERLPGDWPWYLAVQDGMSIADVAYVLHRFDGIFLGGTDKFKYSAHKWCDLAHKHGKKFHYGRAGTLKKLKHAIRVGADSLDSSFPLWTRERFAAFTAQYQHNCTQQEMYAVQE
jgi:hypothetical protein